MQLRWLGWALAAALGTGGCAHEPPASAFDLVRHPRRWDGEAVTVDLYALEIRHEDESYVYLPGEGWLRLDGQSEALARFAGLAGNEFRLTARVHGVVRRSGNNVALSVSRVEAAPLIEPIVVKSPVVFGRARRRHNGAYVQLEGVQYHAFEADSFAGMWLSYAVDATVRCKPVEIEKDEPGRSVRARMTGFVFTRGHHGHLGAYREQFVATEIVYLGDPDCDTN